MTETLALLGGKPVVDLRAPAWPIAGTGIAWMRRGARGKMAGRPHESLL